jgi:hypothetical protein
MLLRVSLCGKESISFESMCFVFSLVLGCMLLQTNYVIMRTILDALTYESDTSPYIEESSSVEHVFHLSYIFFLT